VQGEEQAAAEGQTGGDASRDPANLIPGL